MNQYKNRKCDFNEKRLNIDLDEEDQYPELIEQYEFNKYNKNYDFSIPQQSHDKYGNAYLYGIRLQWESVNNVSYQINLDQVNSIFFSNRNSSNFHKTLVCSIVDEFNVAIDFQHTKINDIKNLSSFFDLTNLSHINLSIYLDELFEKNAIKFMQTVLNLQSLKCCRIEINLKSKNYDNYNNCHLDMILKQLKFNSNINHSEIYLNKRFFYSCTCQFFEIIHDQGKINKLFFSHFAQIELDMPQCERVEFLEIKSSIDLSETQINQFLKKLINLKSLKIGLFSNFKKNEEEQRFLWSEILQTISELKQLKKLKLYFKNLSPSVKELNLESQNLECLNIIFRNKMIPIKCQNLYYLDVTFSEYENGTGCEPFEYLLGQIIPMNNLKLLKINFVLSENHRQQQIDDIQKKQRMLIQKLKKRLKRLVNFEIIVQIY